MSSDLIITLVSEQTIPNVQFLKWYFKNNLHTVDLLFISTKKMEDKNKSSDIKKPLEYLSKFFYSVQTLIVNENQLNEIQESLKSFLQKEKFEKIIANITGGTKMMSLGLYEVCKEFKNSEIYYQPIGEDLQKIFPCRETYSINELLTLEEFMKAHGITYRFHNDCVKDWEFNKSVYEKVIKNNRNVIKQLVAIQNNSYFKNIFKRQDAIDMTTIDETKLKTDDGASVTREEVCILFENLSLNPKSVSRDQLRYITGGWFEEFTFQKIKNDSKIPEKNIALNVNIEKGNDKNELDVIYLDSQNQLNVVECKSFVEGKDGTKVLMDALYKLQAIKKSKFGLSVKSQIYTQSIVEKESALNKAKEFNIGITDGDKLKINN